MANTTMSPPVGKKSALACALIGLVWVWVLAAVWRGPDSYQFDFKTYYCAVQVYQAGYSPYEVANVRVAGGNDHLLGFYYPLSTLAIMGPFGHMDYVTAHRVWIVLKTIALVALLLVWKRFFLRDASWLLLIAALLGFQAATMWDLKVGNITVFEQLWLWTGFAFLVRKRPTAFVLCIVVASLAKLLPAIFILLLFVPALRSRANTVRAIAGVLALALITLLPFVANWGYFEGFLRGLTSQHPPLRYNPSILGIVDELGRHSATAFLADGWMKLVPIGAYYALVVAMSWKLMRRAASSMQLQGLVLVAALLYAIVAPRLIVYSYMIAIVPVLVLVLPSAGRSRLGEYGYLAAGCVGGLAIFPATMGSVTSDAVPLMLIWACWLALVAIERRGELTAV